jgi:hypothetical protein
MSQKCEVCGSETNIVGVFGSMLGPMSFCFCQTCVAEDAEPLWAFEHVYENCGVDVALHVTQCKTFIDGKYITWEEFIENKKTGTPA